MGEFASHAHGEHPELFVDAYSDLGTYLSTMRRGAERHGISPTETDVHAGLLETSQMLFIRPELVGDFSKVEGYRDPDEGWLDILFEHGVDRLSATGVLGSPPAATAEIGESIMNELVGELRRWFSSAILGGRDPCRQSAEAHATQ
jgi:creatinine amidohydrolase